MIELKNVSKIYKSKKGLDTTALNNINLKIGNCGMVFIVGKSGSGKSTLLNLLGGLDCLTSGEISVNGHNIEKFTNQQFDSYRNTYIGFIFQEFNVLELYDVYENIELSLKLQNKNSSRTEIDELLKKLGIENLGFRKINELSGGQKQRVAIARALIKQPEIILADEPTGNLDQSSSEQIFHILKEISKEKLVIVVSHDKESALKYADRLIEISDGNVISDYSSEIPSTNDIFELKKSKLPLSYALKMALASFKAKPIRLFMTVLLTTISLIFMGLTVNFSLFDRTMLVTNTMRDNNNYVYTVKHSEFGALGSITPLLLTEKDFTYIEKLTESKLNKAYQLYDNGKLLNFELGKQEINSSYYTNSIGRINFVEVEDARVLGTIIGKEPKENNELVIHKYLADCIIKFGIKTIDGEIYFPKNYQVLIKDKKKIKLGKNEVIITGIVDDDDLLFQEAKRSGHFKSRELESFFQSNYMDKARTIYVKGFTESAILDAQKDSFLNQVSLWESIGKGLITTENIISLNNTTIDILTKDGLSSRQALDKGEIILSIDAFKKADKDFDKKFIEYSEKNSDKTYEVLLRDFIIFYLNEHPTARVYFNVYLPTNELREFPLKIVGVSLNEFNYISEKYIEEYEPITKQVYSVEIYDDNQKHLEKVFNQLLFESFTAKIDTGTYYNYSVDNSDDLAYIMGAYAGLNIYITILSLVFILFTFLLFSNFIVMSISNCKKEIGILRALGATNKDVIKIFGYESFIIGLVSWIFSIIGWILVCNSLNNSLFGNRFYVLKGIVTHPFIPIIILIYTIAIAILITGASIRKITNIKPMDAILNK